MVARMLSSAVMMVFRKSLESAAVETSVATIATPTIVVMTRPSRAWVSP